MCECHAVSGSNVWVSCGEWLAQMCECHALSGWLKCVSVMRWAAGSNVMRAWLLMSSDVLKSGMHSALVKRKRDAKVLMHCAVEVTDLEMEIAVYFQKIQKLCISVFFCSRTTVWEAVGNEKGGVSRVHIYGETVWKCGQRGHVINDGDLWKRGESFNWHSASISNVIRISWCLHGKVGISFGVKTGLIQRCRTYPCWYNIHITMKIQTI